ncbi:hypothetical protein Ddye_016281 [Dipteronia dyeriana]|uniref:Large ribosomal subunit protein eL14 domain-containing protein n=1 Tax=Dipteronia dyeriana TaxID=168575 RepID=A0AAD9U7C4_9ROSI|nr:hypothetical protein Ddye_016281 [Dipteronia dyeriana]
MPFKRYVEIGRVALVNYGKDYGKLVVIVDVVDQNRALVDAPDMIRSQMNFKRLSLTDITVDIKRAPTKKTLIEAMEKADVKNKWENSSWGRKLIVQKRRAVLNDFDRFKLMLAKIKVCVWYDFTSFLLCMSIAEGWTCPTGACEIQEGKLSLKFLL